MKIMQINCVYNTGSTGKIIYDIHTELKKQNIESIICYGRGNKTDDIGVYKTSSEFLAKFNNVKSRFTGMPYNGSFFATKKLLGIIKTEKPDVVHLHCINGFFVNIYKLVRFLKKNKIPTVVTHHGEFLYTGNCGHAYECEEWKTGCARCPSAKNAINSHFFDFTGYNFRKMKKVFSGFERLISIGVSPWVESRAKQSPIFSEYENTYVLNGLDTEIFKPCENDLKKTLQIEENKKVILHVTASFTSEVKGGKYIIELAKHFKEDAVIIVVGNRETPTDLPDNIKAVGRVENQTELAKYYSMADLTVVTGKRETFSMPVAESLCCGTPVVGFLAGGPETIAISGCSEFVEFGDIEALEKVIRRWFLKDKLSDEMVLKSQRKYDKKRMREEYIQKYKEVLKNG